MNLFFFLLFFKTLGLSDRLGEYILRRISLIVFSNTTFSACSYCQHLTPRDLQLTCWHFVLWTDFGETTVALCHRLKHEPWIMTRTEHQLQSLLTAQIQGYHSAVYRLLSKHQAYFMQLITLPQSRLDWTKPSELKLEMRAKSIYFILKCCFEYWLRVSA